MLAHVLGMSAGCRPNEVHPVSGILRGAAEIALVLSAASSGVMGIAVAVVELKRGKALLQCCCGQAPGLAVLCA